MTEYPATLAIHQLRLSVHLGVGKAEREKPQPVDLNAHFYFQSLPQCALDDEAEQFICYDTISQALSAYVQGKEFRFIEYLCMDLHRVIRHHLDEQLTESFSRFVGLSVQIHKCAAPVPFMLGGASFTFSDLPADAALPAGL